MITFQLEDKTAEAVVSVLNATAGHASFLDTLNEQFNAQFAPAAPVVQEVVAAPVVEEVVEAPKKTKAKVESEE
jgi:chemotaxis protein CheY-P-specific phosphatase CheC